MSGMPGAEIDEVLKRHVGDWMAVPGVVGVYGGMTPAGKKCIVIMRSVPMRVLRGKIPESVDGFPVMFEDASDLRPMSGAESGPG